MIARERTVVASSKAPDISTVPPEYVTNPKPPRTYGLRKCRGDGRNTRPPKNAIELAEIDDALAFSQTCWSMTRRGPGLRKIGCQESWHGNPRKMISGPLPTGGCLKHVPETPKTTVVPTFREG